MKIGNLEVYGIIYKITNLVNGKVYIGQTIKKNGFKDRYPYSGEGVERVYKLHKYRKENGDDYNNHLLKSIEKYGFDKFKVIETFDYAFSKKELDIKEQLYISLYNSNNDLHGYNRTIGGESFESGGRHYNSKDIYCITFDKVFSSIVEAENHYDNISKGAISSMLQGKQNKVIINGINTVWCYFEDYKKMTKNEIDLLIYKSTDEYRSKVLSEAHIGKYTPSENPNSKKVICLTTGEIFNSAKEAIEKYNCSGLYQCLNGRMSSSGKHPITKEKLRWLYYDSYINMSKEEISELINRKIPNNGKPKSIICLTTGEIFNSVGDAIEKYNAKNISACLKGKRKTSGCHPITGEKLEWEYYKK